MVDWTSPAEIAKEQRAFVTMVHVFSGLYMWEFLTHLDFEWSFITGKRQFHWPMIFYFLGRYSQLCSLVGLLTLVNNTNPHVNCGALFTFSQLMGQAAIGSASLNLAIRAMVLWYWKRYIVIPLVILILGHWALLMQGVQIKGVFDLQANACVQFSSGDWTLPATFIYSMCLDFTVFCLSMYQLVIVQGRRTHLLNLLFTDGLIYFGCAFLTNVPAVVFMLLKLNSETPVLSGFPVTVVSTVIACRAVRRLAKFQTGGAQVSVGIPGTANLSISTLSSPTRSRGRRGFSFRASKQVTPPETLNIQMTSVRSQHTTPAVDLERQEPERKIWFEEPDNSFDLSHAK